jgi:opacity protein-like surface antigen
MVFELCGFQPQKHLMKFLVFVIILCFPFISPAQRLHADIYAGVANYQGDLQGKAFTFDNAGFAAGIGLSYDLTRRFRLRTAFNYAKIEGNDKDNTTAKGVEVRNLSFRTNILEGQLALEYNLFDLEEKSWTPYAFAGGAVYHYNPYTFDSTGAKAYLQPLSTEGQGLEAYPDRKPYKLTQFAIPFGGGLKLALSGNVQLGFEFGFRKLFNDYLDDVSDSYADSSLLAAARGPQAVALAYRGDELPNGAPYPAAGAQRGNPKMKDWYYMTAVRLSFRLGNGGNGGGSGRGTGCPGNVY